MPVVALTLPAVVLTGLVLWLGRGETEEFSPQGLCFRRKTVWYVPELNLPIFSLVTSTWPHPLLEMWIRRGLVTALEPARDWELVGYWTPGRPMKQTILHDLTCPEEVGFPEDWQRWTAAHPAEASILWSSVISQIRARQYLEAIKEMQCYAWGSFP